ncbi:uromodulin-like 1 isoform X1 [Carlito syrichta]|uniref:Uromodulin-like 1 isoform X1 n=1 Tax=Carlito syrichta TaxID=1868482 RepID=A0A1U7T3V5_CARSF|nr:uromodulin-like 1 isoform X1 [Carlito syrichta]
MLGTSGLALLALLSVVGSSQASGFTEKGLSLLSYQLCTYRVTHTIQKVEAVQTSHVTYASCGGWIPWRLCPKTVYRTQYLVVEIPEPRNVTDCCEGYEQLGLYCVLSLNRSGEFASRPGICPMAGPEPSTSLCLLDTDCPGLQKCCSWAGGRHCMAPVPQAPARHPGSSWYNVTVLVKMNFQELKRVDPKLLNHMRLLHSLVTSALQPLDSSVHHLHSVGRDTSTTVSWLLLGLLQPLPIANISAKLDDIMKRVYEVINVQVQDVNECAYEELNACSAQGPCANLEGSYQCICHQASRALGPQRLNNMCEDCPPISDYMVLNVTSSSFQVSWSLNSTQSRTFLVQVYRGKELIRSTRTWDLAMVVSGLEAGVLYKVEISYQGCGAHVSAMLTIKTDAQMFEVTIRIMNRNLTEDLLNHSSIEYQDFSRQLLHEVENAFPLVVSDLYQSGKLRLQIVSLQAGSVVVRLRLIVHDPVFPVGISTLSPMLQPLLASTAFQVDQQGTHVQDWDECVDSSEHDCSPAAQCINLEGSYTCQCRTARDANPSRVGRTCEGDVVSPTGGVPSSVTGLSDPALGTGTTALGPGTPTLSPSPGNPWDTPVADQAWTPGPLTRRGDSGMVRQNRNSTGQGKEEEAPSVTPGLGMGLWSTSQGSISQGSINQGSTSQGSINQGSTSQGSIKQGSTRQGNTSQGSTSWWSTSQRSIDQDSTDQGSISQESTNRTSQGSTSQGSISHRSTYQGSTIRMTGTDSLPRSSAPTRNSPPGATDGLLPHPGLLLGNSTTEPPFWPAPSKSPTGHIVWHASLPTKETPLNPTWLWNEDSGPSHSTDLPQNLSPASLETPDCGPVSIGKITISNVTSTSFHLAWAADLVLSPTFQLSLMALQGPVMVETYNTSMSLSGLEPGILHLVDIVARVCGKESARARLKVRTAAQKLSGRVRLANIRYLESFRNTSSQEYRDFLELFFRMVRGSLPATLLQDMDAGGIRMEVTSITNGSVVVEFHLLIVADVDIQEVSAGFLAAFQDTTLLEVIRGDTFIWDYNECERKEDDCVPGTSCRNTFGAFTCSCEGGAPNFPVEYSGRLCEGDSPGIMTQGPSPKQPTSPAGTRAAPMQGDGPTPQDLPPRLSLTGAVRVLCDIEKVAVAIQRRFLLQEAVPESSLYLGHPSCNVSHSNGTHVLLETGWSECGTVVQSNMTTTVVRTTLRNDLSPDGVIHYLKILSPIHCAFQNDLLTSSGYTPEWGVYTIIEDLHGAGSFVTEMQLFIGDSPIPQNYSVSASDDVKIEVGLYRQKSNLKVVLTECWATPSSNAQDPVTFGFINNSCPVPNTYTSVIENGNSNKAQFKLRIFSFINNSIVYLHCKLRICMESPGATCKINCNDFRLLKSSENSATHQTSWGPLIRSEGESPGTEPGLSTGYIALIVVVLCALVAGVAALLILRYQRMNGKYSFRSQSGNFSYQVFYE